MQTLSRLLLLFAIFSLNISQITIGSKHMDTITNSLKEKAGNKALKKFRRVNLMELKKLTQVSRKPMKMEKPGKVTASAVSRDVPSVAQSFLQQICR